MNRKFFASALSALLLGGGAAWAQQSMEKTDEKKVTTESGTKKSDSHTYVGTVTKYEAGKSIKVKSGKHTHSFSLNSSSVETTVDPSVAVGSKVKVVQAKNASGGKTLTINPAS